MKAGLSPYSVEGFNYPPLPAFVLAPLAALPYDAARKAWLIFGQVSLLAAAWALWRALGGGRGALLVVAACWGIAGTMTENLVLGQLHPQLLALLAFSFLFQARQPALAGFLLGGAVALKLWPALLFVALWMRRRTVELVAATLTAGLLIALPLVALAAGGPPPYRPIHAVYWMGTPAALNASAPAVALRLLDRPVRGEPLPASWRHGNHPGGLELASWQRLTAVAVALSVTLGGFAALAGALAARRREPSLQGREPEVDLLLLASVVSLVLVASPIAWYHYQLFQLLPATLIGTHLLRRGAMARLGALALLLFTVTRLPAWGLGANVARHGWESGSPGLLWVVTGTTPMLGALLFYLAVAELRRARGVEGSSQPLQASVRPGPGPALSAAGGP